MSMIHAQRIRAPVLAAYVLLIAVGFCRSGSALSQVETASGADAAPKRDQPVDFRTARVEFRDEFQQRQNGDTVYALAGGK